MIGAFLNLGSRISRAKGILHNIPFTLGESADTRQQEIPLTSQNHSLMDLPRNVVHHLSANNFQSVLCELSFIQQFVQPMNSFLVLFNFKLKRKSEPSNFNHKNGKKEKNVRQRMKKKESFPLPQKQICFASNSMHANFQQ